MISVSHIWENMACCDIKFFVRVLSFPTTDSTSVCKHIDVNYGGHQTISKSEVVEYERNIDNFMTTRNSLEIAKQTHLFPSSVRGDEPVELVEVHLLAGDQRHVAVRRPARRKMTSDRTFQLGAHKTYVGH